MKRVFPWASVLILLLGFPAGIPCQTDSINRCLQGIIGKYATEFQSVKGAGAQGRMIELLDVVQIEVAACGLPKERVAELGTWIEAIKREKVAILAESPSNNQVEEAARTVREALIAKLNELAEPGRKETAAPTAALAASGQGKKSAAAAAPIRGEASLPTARGSSGGTPFLLYPLLLLALLFAALLGYFFLTLKRWRGDTSRAMQGLRESVTSLQQIQPPLPVAVGPNPDPAPPPPPPTPENQSDNSNELLIRMEAYDAKVSNLIALVGKLAEHMERSLQRKEAAPARPPAQRPLESPAPSNPTPKASPSRQPEMEITFPRSSVEEPWRSLIIGAFRERRENLSRFLRHAPRGGNIKSFLETLGRILDQKKDANSFFNELLSHIFIIRKVLARTEYEELKTIFLSTVYDAVQLEEIGIEGEPFNEERHEVVGGSGDGGYIKRVVLPGFKRKYSDDIIRRAQVEL